MYEVPSIAINTLTKKIKEEDLKPKKKAEEDKMDALFKLISVTEVENYEVDSRIGQKFNEPWKEAFADVIKFKLCQSLLSKTA